MSEELYPRECARSACKSKRAKFYNSSTRQYYCGGCARKINYWSVRDHGVELCRKVSG